ncbi:MAG TPA: MFS transporter [Verrucomicrobiae bacterium]|nr:MFS transporter [Verrucomicrobiae bacterium]
MAPTPQSIQRTYLTLLLFNTLAASLVWGINTIFLLDAGLSNFEAFAANAFFTAGMMLFEVPTGVIADLRGRRVSYLLGTITLALATLLYLLMWQTAAPFWSWAVVSVFLGLGFTFFSGAVEAWLVDALTASGFKGKLESVFAKGEIVEGSAMLVGSTAGGVIAQYSNLGVPYIIRAVILLLTFILAFKLMKDIGFTPTKGKNMAHEVKVIAQNSLTFGLKNPSVRWLMLMTPFVMGALAYAFYAMQPYLLELWGDPNAYGIAGLAAAIIAGAQIAGGLLVPHIGRIFKRHTTVLIIGVFLSGISLAISGLVLNFWVVVAMLVIWGMVFSATMPVRQAYFNSLIPSKQRATVLSFDSLLGSAGGVVSQPLLGKAADMWGYAHSYLIVAAFQLLALPFALLARRQSDKTADVIIENPITIETPSK